jgi:hypothetical protein
MTDTIKVTVNVAFPGNVNLAPDPKSIAAEAYDKIEAVISKGTKDSPFTLEIQPSDTLVKFISISADNYIDATLSYSINAPAANKDARIPLDWVQVFCGAGMLKLLTAVPNKLCFYNEGTKDATVTILVGRSAVISKPAATQPAANTPAATQPAANTPAANQPATPPTNPGGNT